MTEADRLEILVHELGHYLGAAHSPEADSVMRRMLGESPARRAHSRITFDPINALAIYLWAEELRFRRIASLHQLSPATGLRLRQLYGMLAEVFPEDRAATRFIALLESHVNLPPRHAAAPPVPQEPATQEPPKQELVTQDPATPERAGVWPVAATRYLLQEIMAAARDNQTRDAARPDAAPKTGDELLEHYIRQAAKAAENLPPDVAAHAFLLALGIGLDSSDLLRNHPLLAGFIQAVEPPAQRAERLRVLGEPTVHDRRDLAHHFVVSAFLTAGYGAEVSEAAGVAKEILDAHGGTGFSFADLAANHAGITLATALLAEQIPLTDIAARFTVPDFVPDIDDLPEGLSWQEFLDRYGSLADQRYRQRRAEILQRIARLRGYRN